MVREGSLEHDLNQSTTVYISAPGLPTVLTIKYELALKLTRIGVINFKKISINRGVSYLF